MARVFSAVDIEDEKILRKLKHIRDTLNLGFSPVKPEKMHVTLEFFEDINEEEWSNVEKALSNIDVDPFEMQIKGLGAFPSEDYIRVVWAGVESSKIFKLQKQAGLHNISTDNKHEFKPHITMMRVDNISQGKKKKLKSMIEEHKDEDFGTVTVDKVKLLESRITGKGSNYRKISEHQL
jgi:2'-5' RNA ligase